MLCSGRSRGGARARPPLFWVKKKEITEGRKAAGQAKQNRPLPPEQTQSIRPRVFKQ